VNAPFAPHPFDSGLSLPADGLIVHFNNGLGTGSFLNHPTLPIGPEIDFVWSPGYDILEFIDEEGNFLTNAEPTLEDFSLIYNNTSEVYQNPANPDFGFGHGMVLHKRTAINNCNIRGFPGDGIRLVGTNFGNFFLEGQRIWGLFYEIDGIMIANPPDPEHILNQLTPTPLPDNYIQFRYSEYVGISPVPDIDTNLTDLEINFLHAVNKTQLDGSTVLDNLEIEILIGGEDLSVLLMPFFEVSSGPIAANSVIFSINADTASFPFGQFPIRIKATYDGSINAVSEVFFVYACDNVNNGYPISVYTNVNVSQIYNSRISHCKRNGLYVAGIDANAGAIVSLNTVRNGSWGIFDNSGLGNTYLGCHSEGNLTGAYTTGVESGVNYNLFIGCTGEGRVLLEIPAQWIGGSTEYSPNYFPDGVWRNGASILQQGGIFPLYRQVVRFRNSTGTTPDPEDGVFGGAGVFFDAGPNAPVDILGFGHTNSREWALSVKELPNIGTGNSNYYVFNEANADAGRGLSLSGLLTGGETPPGMPYFFNPILMSKNDEEGEKKIRITVGEGQPVAEAVHVDGIPYGSPPYLQKIVGNVGDIHFNSAPLYLGESSDNDERDNVAWICTESFNFNSEVPEDSIEAIWKPFWFIYP